MATYVMSDLHGQYDLFVDMLAKISFSKTDNIYILGDVIDRGPDGCMLLSHIIQEENIHMLLGNHEAMMLECLSSSFPNFIEFANTPEIQLWMQNGGRTTLDDFLLYTHDYQTQVLSWLKSLPLVIPDLMVEGRRYYLVHAHHGLKWHEKEMVLSDLTGPEAKCLLWNRDYEKLLFPNKMPQNTTVIFGHTPVYCFKPSRERKIWRTESGNYINVDCGCAHPTTPVLGCLRLDDMKEFYVS